MAGVIFTHDAQKFVRRATGAGPYFGQYLLLGEDQSPAWVGLSKSWPTEQLAFDDATSAARFAIDTQNFRRAATRAVEAAAMVTSLDSNELGWPTAVHAQRLAATERDVLEVRLLGAKERHWPDIQTPSSSQTPLRCR